MGYSCLFVFLLLFLIPVGAFGACCAYSNSAVNQYGAVGPALMVELGSIVLGFAVLFIFIVGDGIKKR